MIKSNFESLENHFLIATPALGDTLFYRSVIFIAEHNEDGAMGIIINRPLEIMLNVILQKMELDFDNPDVYEQPVYLGGPLQTQRGFVIHRAGPRWDDTIVIYDELCITASKDILESIGDCSGPKESVVALGYSGWGPGQLEDELKDNAWIAVPADPHVIFSVPIEEKWHAAVSLLGIEPSALSSLVGHA